jgi:hypothetical protein
VNLTLTRDIEQEVNQIRLKIYEETKDMTLDQRREYYRKSSVAAAEKYGFRLVASAKDDPRLQLR